MMPEKEEPPPRYPPPAQRFLHTGRTRQSQEGNRVATLVRQWEDESKPGPSAPATPRSPPAACPAFPIATRPLKVEPSIRRVHAVGRGHINNLPLSLEPAAAPRSAPSKTAPPIDDPFASLEDAAADETAPMVGSTVRPISSSQVFRPNALPLHLPELEQYLSDPDLFDEPYFSDPTVLATDTERLLYGYDERQGPTGRKRSKSRTMEAAGGQLKIPSPAVRRRSVAKDTMEEADEGEALLPAKSTGAAQTGSSAAPLPEMFPPLMLLRSTRLSELKSNAVGPRAPPGGFLGAVPAVGSILGTIIDFLIGMEGSSFAAGLLSFELFRDFAQIWSNMTQSQGPPASTSAVSRLLFHTVPSILALDFVSVYGKAVVFFFAWLAVIAFCLVLFYRMTSAYDPNRNVEGYDSQPYLFTSPQRGTKATNILVVFTLTAFYIPLLKLCIDVLTWGSSWWVVPNPYLAGSPAPAPLGPSELYHDPLDFCWTTTMRKDQFNYAWLLVPVAILTLLVYGCWFPLRMVHVIRDMLPHVPEYNELGRRRSAAELQHEYYRLLNRDKSPLNFIYNAYRRRWGFYKPIYILCFKFVNTFIISFLSKNNCVFRSHSNTQMLLIQQAVLLVVMSVLSALHVYMFPFVDPISNRSEFVSRVGYVCTALIGLLVALRVQGSTVYKTTVLYILSGIMYALNAYFAVAGTAFFQHWIKSLQKRLDFSIDIYSPLLRTDKHIARRVWQETLSTILLCGTSFQVPQDQVVAFSVSDSDSWPPYLLWFRGSVAERHVENLKILKAIGMREYQLAVDCSRSHIAERLSRAVTLIQSKYAGPDAYYRPPQPPYPSGVTSWFGKAFLASFPPTLVIRYDQGSEATVALTSLLEMENFIEQNASEQVRSKRMVRRAIRALEGQMVFCPYSDVQCVGPAFWRGKQPTRYVTKPIAYTHGVLKIKRRATTSSGAYNFSSGFDVSVLYEEGRQQEADGVVRVRRRIEVGASRAFGLHDDSELSPQLAQFLRDNENTVRCRVGAIGDMLEQYRARFHAEAVDKARVMSYAFLTDVFHKPLLSPAELVVALRKSGSCKRVARLSSDYQAAITILYERMASIRRTPVHRWWWLLWDELCRMNSGDYKAIRAQRHALSPQYPGSIAYRPLPRAELERFLQARGLWQADGSKGLFNRGLLNRIYFHLDQMVFAGSTTAIPIGFGPSESSVQPTPYQTLRERDLIRAREEAVETAGFDCGDDADCRRMQVRPDVLAGANAPTVSRLTGGGTDYDSDSIFIRPAFAWEQRIVFAKPSQSRWSRVTRRLLEWLALQPFVLDHGSEPGLWLYLEERDGRYVVPPRSSSKAVDQDR